MEEKVIDIKRINHQGNENDYYEITYIENGVEDKKKLRYDDDDFKKCLENYEKFLKSEINRCENILKPYEFIKSLKQPAAITYGILSGIGVIILLFHKDGFAPLRLFSFGAASVGLGGSGLFLHLENKFKNEQIEKNLKKVKFELKKLPNLKSKNMVGTQRKKYLEQAERESMENEFSEDKEHIFKPDRPTFLSHNGYEENSVVKTENKTSKFSDVPNYLKTRPDVIPLKSTISDNNREVEMSPINPKHPNKKIKQENSVVENKSSSLEPTRFNSNLKREANPNYKPDRPSFNFEREYQGGYGISEESDIPEHLKRR